MISYYNWLICLFNCIELTLASDKLEYFVFKEHPRYNDINCKVGKGNIDKQHTPSSCAGRCVDTANCKGFFYSNITKKCGMMQAVSIPGHECRHQTGSNYYFGLLTAKFKPYNFTPSDFARLGPETEEEICLSYAYHSLNEEVDGYALGCGDSICCISKGCYSGISERYNGTWNVSKQGFLCQRWDSTDPHYHTQAAYGDFPDGSVTDAHNYCRDPDYEGILWCYTTNKDLRWETCDVPQCP